MTSGPMPSPGKTAMFLEIFLAPQASSSASPHRLDDLDSYFSSFDRVLPMECPAWFSSPIHLTINLFPPAALPGFVRAMR